MEGREGKVRSNPCSFRLGPPRRARGRRSGRNPRDSPAGRGAVGDVGGWEGPSCRPATFGVTESSGKSPPGGANLLPFPRLFLLVICYRGERVSRSKGRAGREARGPPLPARWKGPCQSPHGTPGTPSLEPRAQRRPPLGCRSEEEAVSWAEPMAGGRGKDLRTAGAPSPLSRAPDPPLLSPVQRRPARPTAPTRSPRQTSRRASGDDRRHPWRPRGLQWSGRCDVGQEGAGGRRDTFPPESWCTFSGTVSVVHPPKLFDTSQVVGQCFLNVHKFLISF